MLQIQADLLLASYGLDDPTRPISGWMNFVDCFPDLSAIDFSCELYSNGCFSNCPYNGNVRFTGGRYISLNDNCSGEAIGYGRDDFTGNG